MLKRDKNEIKYSLAFMTVSFQKNFHHLPFAIVCSRVFPLLTGAQIHLKNISFGENGAQRTPYHLLQESNLKSRILRVSEKHS